MSGLRLLARTTRAAMVVVTACVVSAQRSVKPFLRITSPANGAVVRSSQTVLVKVTGIGEYPLIALIGPDVAGGVQGPLGKPPWTISVAAPAEPGKTYFTATGSTVSGAEVDSNPVEVDVEPLEIPPVTIFPSRLIVGVGQCVHLRDGSSVSCGQNLLINSRDLKGELVSMNRSTKIKFTSLSPAIAKVSSDGSTLFGMSAGSTKITVFGKYSVDVTVR